MTWRQRRGGRSVSWFTEVDHFLANLIHQLPPPPTKERHYRGYDGAQILPDGRRPIRWVIRDTIAALPNIFPFGRAWTERWWR